MFADGACCDCHIHSIAEDIGGFPVDMSGLRARLQGHALNHGSLELGGSEGPVDATGARDVHSTIRGGHVA
jgi:hypothetical protein